MLNLQKIIFRNFKCFKSEVTFNLTIFNPQSLNFITGLNKIEPNLTSNGVGKSSLVEGITWLFFGKTSRGLKASNIANWEIKKDCSVSGIIEKNNEIYTLTRTWSPNSLQLTFPNTTIKTITQEELEQFLDVDFSSFLFSTHIAQFLPKFFELTPSEKLEIFTKILGNTLTQWDKALDKTSNKIKEIEKNIQETTLLYSKNEGRLYSIPKIAQKDIDTWKEDHNKTILTVKNEIDCLNKHIIDTQKFPNEIIEKSKQLKNKQTKKIEYDSLLTEITPIYNQNLNTITNLKQTLFSITTNITLLQQQQTNIDAEITQINKIITKIQNTTTLSICPTCFQKVEKQKLQDEIHKQINIKETLEEGKKQIQIKISHLQKQQNSIQQTIQQSIQDSEQLLESHKDITNTIKILNVETTFLQKEIENLTETFKNTQNKLLIELKKKQETLKIIEQEKCNLLDKKRKYDKINKVLIKTNSYLQEELLEYKNLIEIYKYWQKGFPKLKLWLLEETLQEVEININNTLEKLGLTNWNVSLKIGIETKTSGIKDGINALIKAPNTTESVPFECWSGGEGQRLLLASTLGIASFIRDKRSGGFNFIIFDEPTQHLSEFGIDSFIEIIKEYCKLNNLKGFLIDHKDLSTKGYFDKSIKIIKDIEGSNICVE